ncbi:S46 family peptidase [Flavobacterium columnare]|uniref:Dipeptidyl-peptidase n=1 Tax=Flavobacterium columnare TaxID=996 RepID=A0AAI8CHX2_9FLAO|nr:S46 family peptidase [Flavobacterium columnare]AMO20102.1 S46 family peptidase [Flavobacterium columnare]AUX18052.1 peptidase S46 [Flavobacterium columnare]QOG57118.1 S46 family peptidase [Flavobacterium columnare]QOG59842.1 S46 family peptidase [Flavobacterium columnare]QOG62562.1 S46 family peptidase [Flavobacterium columnare]
MKFLRLLLILVVSPFFAQQGGMWIPSLLKGMNETEMKNLGIKISAEDIYSTNKSSLKDAVPHFDGGCTAEVISPKGLILTNHHCGYDNIQSHSTVEHDYLTNGFWAYKMEEELPNKNLFVTFIIRIEDVTSKVLEGIASISSELEKQKKIQENISFLSKTLPKESWQENQIKTFYDGNQYLLFVTETFRDVRLVGAPPSSIGKFGSDTDNWVWPRHTGDFSLFRIYADKNNHPAEYSKDNVPYKPKHFFPISIKGVHENDFTMVMGYPGRTQEYLPSYAVEQIINDLNPARIELRDATLKTQNSFMRKDPAIKIQYAAKNASIANAWKKWMGEIKGLKKANAVQAKQKFETELTQKINKAGKQAEYGTLLNEFKTNYKNIREYAIARDYFSEVVMRNCEILNFGYRLYQLEQILNTKGEQIFTERKNNLITNFEGTYKNFNVSVDEKVFEQLIHLYATKSPKQFLPNSLNNINASQLTTDVFQNSKLTSYSGLKELLSGDTKSIIEKINQDKGYVLAKSIIDAYDKNVAPKYNEINLKNIALQRTYMKAILELSPKSARIFPDANSTLRVTYGQVKGYKPSDAVIYSPFTTLDGVIEKYIPGDYEFDVPKKLIDLYHSKNFGQYADKNGKMPVAFIATNHTTGGNSGSPALDANGNLIGCNFDRVWEGTMSDIYYNPEICRNIMVDARYILFIIDKFAGAQNLIEEIKIVQPIGTTKNK